MLHKLALAGSVLFLAAVMASLMLYFTFELVRLIVEMLIDWIKGR